MDKARNRGLSVPLRYRSPLQNPVAKLLNHRREKGTTKRSFVSAEASINAAKVKFETSEASSERRKPEEGSLIDDAKNPER